MFRDNTSKYLIIYLLFLCSLAVLGYLITPDSSSFANNQHLEISMKSPGYSCYFYSEEEEPAANILKTLVFGKREYRSELAISSYKIQNDSIHLLVIDPLLANNKEILSFLVQDKAQTFITEHIARKVFWLGTDQFGRDVLSRLIIGLRISLSVGFISVLISLLIGVSLGAIAGYYGRWVDQLVMWFINVIWSLPSLLLIIAISFALGKGFWQMFIAIGLSMWVEVARVVRGQVMSIKQNEYIEAAHALAYSNTRIITKHILPNIWGPVIVISAANFSTAILVEAGLSFLGLGVTPPIPSLGGMIRESYIGIFFGYPWLSFFPGMLIVSIVFSFMMIGRVLKRYI
ncbi:ABC transporter permease [Lentimicrobium sp. S6]|uniref:ABC transporter permease n=1 Tax=Lentimicrobium sp. S6 TaxID=2735872 RepID=UPI001C12F4C6|nr:ABC transporter permease [Lentimicrobium sp. S6]